MLYVNKYYIAPTFCDVVVACYDVRKRLFKLSCME